VMMPDCGFHFSHLHIPEGHELGQKNGRIVISFFE
jgi:hypothetical protein